VVFLFMFCIIWEINYGNLEERPNLKLWLLCKKKLSNRKNSKKLKKKLKMKKIKKCKKKCK